MADRVHNGTLTANDVTTVGITRHAGKLSVTNRSDSGTIWVRLDGEDPQVEDEDCFPVLALQTAHFDTAVPAINAAQIKLISDESLDYTVAGTAN